jgi:hypothetical protein
LCKALMALPLMMIALVDGLELLPGALSTRIGVQTQRPLAILVMDSHVIVCWQEGAACSW